ncbi:MAG TPA: Gfo/Idh/MocA family oxidoreductase, partial [Armatimonadota bacterium]|nr:Gfo/Idh/MocA family oxidoreductase [Armatimonadota bacterium]
VPDSYPYGRDLALSLRGTGGAISWSPSFEGVRETLFVCSDTGEYAASPRRHLSFELESVPGYSGVMGRQYLADIAECIRTGGKPPITGQDGARALEVVEAIYQSAETGRAVRLSAE